LGLHLDANFSWRSHVEAMLSKATKRLYFLKLLKRAGVPCAQLQHFYVALIRPILEYAAPVWHHLLTNYQSYQIVAIQNELSILSTVLVMACHTLTPFTLPVSVASEHVENKWHATFLSLLLNQLRAYIIYSHLHVTLNYYHD